MVSLASETFHQFSGSPFTGGYGDGQPVCDEAHAVAADSTLAAHSLLTGMYRCCCHWRRRRIRFPCRPPLGQRSHIFLNGHVFSLLQLLRRRRIRMKTVMCYTVGQITKGAVAICKPAGAGNGYQRLLGRGLQEIRKPRAATMWQYGAGKKG